MPTNTVELTGNTVKWADPGENWEYLWINCPGINWEYPWIPWNGQSLKWTGDSCMKHKQKWGPVDSFLPRFYRGGSPSLDRNKIAKFKCLNLKFSLYISLILGWRLQPAIYTALYLVKKYTSQEPHFWQINQQGLISVYVSYNCPQFISEIVHSRVFRGIPSIG